MLAKIQHLRQMARLGHTNTRKKTAEDVQRSGIGISFAGEMMRLANKPDGLPSRPELQKQMLDWCERAWGDLPAESSVRDLIARLYPEYI